MYISRLPNITGDNYTIGNKLKLMNTPEIPLSTQTIISPVVPRGCETGCDIYT